MQLGYKLLSLPRYMLSWFIIFLDSMCKTTWNRRYKWRIISCHSPQSFLQTLFHLWFQQNFIYSNKRSFFLILWSLILSKAPHFSTIVFISCHGMMMINGKWQSILFVRFSPAQFNKYSVSFLAMLLTVITKWNVVWNPRKSKI